MGKQLAQPEVRAAIASPFGRGGSAKALAERAFLLEDTMHILICDDDAVFAARVETLVRDFFALRGLQVECTVCHSGEETLARQNRTETELPYDSIYYLESDLRKINVYGDVAHQPLCSYYGKLNELPQALFENGFLRVGRSAVVNMKYIRQISSYMVTLRNGVKLGVSRNGYAEIRSTYLEWKGQFGDD